MLQNTGFYKNYDKLIEKGQIKVRKDALEIIEAGINRAIPYSGTMNLIQRSNRVLTIGKETILLNEVNHIYVVGAGKGSFPIAQALDEKIGDLITEGIVVVKDGEKRTLPHI